MHIHAQIICSFFKNYLLQLVQIFVAIIWNNIQSKYLFRICHFLARAMHCMQLHVQYYHFKNRSSFCLSVIFLSHLSIISISSFYHLSVIILSLCLSVFSSFFLSFFLSFCLSSSKFSLVQLEVDMDPSEACLDDLEAL